MEDKVLDSNNIKSVELNDLLLVSQAPHLRTNKTVNKIMLDVIIALTPALIGSIYFYGFNALKLILITVASWPSIMSTYINPDGITSATPLAILKSGSTALPSINRMLIGDIGGSLGETSAVLLLIGALYLLIKGIIDWKIPTLFIASTCAMLLILGIDPSLMIYYILGGGLILGAFFMATDYATAPITPYGKIIFAVGAGILTALIRVKGGMPEGVSYAILLMNVATPVIERITKPKVFGVRKQPKGGEINEGNN